MASIHRRASGGSRTGGDRAACLGTKERRTPQFGAAATVGDTGKTKHTPPCLSVAVRACCTIASVEPGTRPRQGGGHVGKEARGEEVALGQGPAPGRRLHRGERWATRNCRRASPGARGGRASRARGGRRHASVQHARMKLSHRWDGDRGVSPWELGLWGGFRCPPKFRGLSRGPTRVAFFLAWALIFTLQETNQSITDSR